MQLIIPLPEFNAKLYFAFVIFDDFFKNPNRLTKSRNFISF